MDFSVSLALILRVPPKMLLCFFTLTFLLTCYYQTVLLQGRHLQGEEDCFKLVDSNSKLENLMIISNLWATFRSSLVSDFVLLNSRKVHWIMLLLLFNIREKFRFFGKSPDSDLLPIDWQNSTLTGHLSVFSHCERSPGVEVQLVAVTSGPPGPPPRQCQTHRWDRLSACQLQGRSRLIV